MPFSLRSERSIASTTACERYLVVDLSPPPSPSAVARAPVNVALVVDRSGSMGGGKLTLALAGVERVIAALSERDRFCVVVFDGEVDVIVPSTLATDDARRRAAAAVASIRPRGNTDLGVGWLTGAAEVGSALGPEAAGRCIVLTDGQANRGITDPGELGHHARELRSRGVTTSAIGLGEGFNEFLLGDLSEQGGGRFHFAAHADALVSIFERELGDLFAESAREVAIVIDAPSGARVESLNGYPEDGGAFVVGSLVGGNDVEAAFRVTLPAGAVDDAVAIGVRVRDRDGFFGSERHVLTWRRADDATGAAARADARVAVVAAELEDAVGRRAALEQNQRGDYAGARETVDATLGRLRGLDDGGPPVAQLVHRLTDDLPRLTTPMRSLHSKEAYRRSFSTQKRRPRDDDFDHHWPSRAESASRASAVRPPAPMTGVQLYAGSRSLLVPVDAGRRALSGIDAGSVMLHGGMRGIEHWPSPLSREREQRLVDELRRAAPAISLVFVEQELGDRWFSHWHPDARVVVVSTAGFTEMTGLPLKAFAAYELLLHGLRTRGRAYDANDFAHAQSRGCLFDFCADKAEIAVKLQVGHVCEQCRAGLARADIDPVSVEAQWSSVQALSHPEPRH